MTASSLWYEETERGMQWASMLADVFRKRETKYLCMRVHQLSGLFATVYIKQEHKKYVDGIKSQVVRVGFMGVMGNKGSICFRFRLYHTTFCFIMAHLAPHTDQVAQRNQQFHDIMRTCTFEDPTGSLRPARHDVLIFGGDLNYRIARPYEHVMSAIERNDLDFLTSNDQLYEEIERETAFVGFSEPRLNFLPTYRFDVGTVQYDSSEKKRTPAYADRILYKVNPRTAKIQPIQYVSAQSTMISDHKPVLAEFEVVARVRDPEKYKELYEVYEMKYYQQEANNRFPEIEEWDLVDDKYDHSL
jgi:endonuclease/exonuclease/phosphatase family metal-dependent hydrolase